MTRAISFLKAVFFGLMLYPGFVFGLWQPAFAQQADQNRAIGVDVFPAPPVGEKITRPIAFTDAKSPDYKLQLEKDEYLEIEVEQFDVALAITMADHDGVEIETFTSPNGRFGFLRVVFIAPVRDTYFIGIAVRGPGPGGKPDSGSFSLTLRAKRPATPHDRAVRLAWEARRIATDAPDTRPGIPIALKALAMFREQGDQPGEAEVLFQLGRLHFYADEPEAGIRYLNESLGILEKVPDESLSLRALTVLGEAHTQTGEYQTALGIMKRILALDSKKLGKQNRAVILRNLGFLYEYLLDDRSALDCFEKALPLFEELGAPIYVNTVRSHQAGAFLRLGQPIRALEILNATFKSLTIDSPDGAAITQTLLNIGRVHRLMNNREPASRFAALALEQSRRRGLAAPEAEALHLQGLLAADAGETAAAAELFRKSLAISRSLPSRIQEIEDLTELARAEHQLGHSDTALTLISKAVDLTESVRGSLGDDELRTNYLGSVQARYEFFAFLLMELHGKHPDEGFDSRALLVSERAKARSLIDVLRTRRITAPGKADQALILQRQKVQQRINEANQTLVGLSQSATDAERRKTIENDLTAAVAKYRDLTNQLNALNPRYLRLTEPVALDVKDIRAQLADDTVLLEYALGTEKSFLWVVTPTALKSYELPDRAKVEQLARRTYDTLTARGLNPKYEQAGGPEYQARIRKADAEYATVSKELGQILLGPVAAELKGKRLLVVGDGPLLYLPFAALPLPDSGQPLVTRCEITQLPSISTLSVLRQDSAGRQPATKTVAVLADPVFDPADPRVKGNSAVSPGSPARSQVPEVGPTGDITRAVADIDGPDRAGSLKRLPFTRREAEAIGALVPEVKRRIGLDFAASRETVFGENFGQYRFVHFATHGLLNSTQPDLSGVVLSMVNEKGEPQDGFLHAYEVFNLKLPVEMVVLSGCRTGLGKEIRGEGMIGLTRAFLYAGAERVMVSLWAIGDESTSSLMTDTYTGLLRENQRPAAALRSAQLKMMKNPRWAAPFYWAAFTLQGEPR